MTHRDRNIGPPARRHADVRQTGGVSVASSPERQSVRPVLADAVDLARSAVTDLREGGVGQYLGVEREDDCAATHRFVAELPGYRGWQWAVVVAAAPDDSHATVSELALLPGPDALVAPEWVPWNQRIRPGDLPPGALLAPVPDDPRLGPGFMATGDPVVDETAVEVGLGRRQVMSREGRLDAAERWHDGDHGPDSEMAKAAPSTCDMCGFYLPLAGSLRGAFGVCGNEYAADGQVVHAAYGCGAHSDTELPVGAGTPRYDAFDDSAIEVVTVGSPASEEVESPAPEDAAPDQAGPKDRADRTDQAEPTTDEAD
ncbi:DUF3027 domain-containing protein [Rhodococcus sp. HNM0569]|uniref:DUF3027 domain-containing protein n=1 Tax=Rhodococcus sp. HNM0569 TaxID=2716340 RepID=UPI00146AFACF|nr:DUF3027 domain-containing protein [Rhodococcus sp. HNM0569]NLU82430.1 DUF3027 domain-containing protein [Rhodococcus sp. HNM0569]